MKTYHIAEIAPLVQKVAVHIDAVRFREVLRDQLPDCGKVRLLLGAMVLHILQPVVRLLCAILGITHGRRGRDWQSGARKIEGLVPNVLPRLALFPKAMTTVVFTCARELRPRC